MINSQRLSAAGTPLRDARYHNVIHLEGRFVDIGFFVKRRIDFVEQLYETSISPFIEIKYKIEHEVEPYIPEYSEDSEPPFLLEWMTAEESINVIGLQCASLLASSFHLFLKEWVKLSFRYNSAAVMRNIKTEADYKSSFKKGWFSAYQEMFEREFKVNWQLSGANLKLIEELVLVRNRAQHPEDITSSDVRFSKHDLEKLNSPFLIDDHERELLGEDGESPFFNLRIKPEPEKIRSIFVEVRKIVDWLDKRHYDWSKNV